MPTLFVVLDEFSELLSAKPEFIDLFVTIGRVGRSLGVHLLLASQRLEEGRLRGLDTQLSYRIGLRTFSAWSRDPRRAGRLELPSQPGQRLPKKTRTGMPARFKAAYVRGFLTTAAEASPASRAPMVQPRSHSAPAGRATVRRRARARDGVTGQGAAGGRESQDPHEALDRGGRAQPGRGARAGHRVVAPAAGHPHHPGRLLSTAGARPMLPRTRDAEPHVRRHQDPCGWTCRAHGPRGLAGRAGRRRSHAAAQPDSARSRCSHPATGVVLLPRLRRWNARFARGPAARGRGGTRLATDRVRRTVAEVDRCSNSGSGCSPSLVSTRGQLPADAGLRRDRRRRVRRRVPRRRRLAHRAAGLRGARDGRSRRSRPVASASAST